MALMTQITQGLKGTQYEIDESSDEIPKGVRFSSTDIEEKIFRPSFYIDFEENKTGKFNYHNKERTLKVKLYYFAKTLEDSQIELLEIQDFLENIFLDGLKVSESFFIPIENIDIDVRHQNGLLICDFDLYTIEEIEITDTHEIMEDLTLKTKILGGI